MEEQTLKEKVLLYACYTVNVHSNEHEDIDMLNKIFGTNLNLSEVRKHMNSNDFKKNEVEDGKKKTK